MLNDIGVARSQKAKVAPFEREGPRKRARSKQVRCERGELFAYDGVVYIGSIVDNGQAARAFDAAGAALGKFNNCRAAFFAISEAYLAEPVRGMEKRRSEGAG
jgi:hypothetical protein